MKGWIELCSDVNWEDYHGMWARKNGKWYILQWTNMWDSRDKEESLAQYNCDVKMLDLKEIPNNNLDIVLKCYGLKLLAAPFAVTIENDRGEAVTSDPKRVELIVVECCIQYGFGNLLASFTGSKRPLNIRAKARRFAESTMRDSRSVEK